VALKSCLLCINRSSISLTLAPPFKSLGPSPPSASSLPISPPPTHLGRRCQLIPPPPRRRRTPSLAPRAPPKPPSPDMSPSGARRSEIQIWGAPDTSPSSVVIVASKSDSQRRGRRRITMASSSICSRSCPPKQIHDDKVRVHSILDGRCPCLRRGAPVRARCTTLSTPPSPPLDVATPVAAPSHCSAVWETLGGCPGTGACESSSTTDRGTSISPLLRPPYPGTLSSP
jgi:hypothetical protein